MSSAGWWPDPLGRHEMRYHDGERWTEHVSDHGTVSVNPIAMPAPPVPAPMPAPQPPSPFASPPPGAPRHPMPPQALPPDPFGPPVTAPVNSPFGSDPPTPSLPFGSTFEPPPPLIQEAGTPRRVLWFVVGVIVFGAIVAAAFVLAARGAGDGDGTAARRHPRREGRSGPGRDDRACRAQPRPRQQRQPGRPR